MRLLLYTGLLATMLLVSCNNTVPEEDHFAYCTIHHFLADTTAVAWTIDDIALPMDMEYGESENGALKIEAEGSSVHVVIRNETNGDYMINTRVDLQEDRNYHFVLSGTLNQAYFAAFEKDPAPGNGYTALRFMHACPEEGPLDIYQGDTTATPLVADLAFSDHSGLMHIEVLAAKDTIYVFDQGSNAPEHLLSCFCSGKDLLNNASYLFMIAPANADSADAPVILWPRE